MILEHFLRYTQRISDIIYSGRNRSRIVLGTDRKNTVNSGYGDGGENDKESAAIDMVAGFDPESSDVNFSKDKSRLYLSAKSDPDDYIENNKGPAVTGESVFLGISDNVYLSARKKTKILGPKYSILIDEDGNCLIEADTKIEIKVGQNVVRLSSSGIELDAGQGISGRVLTDLDSCVGTDPVTGSPIVSTFQRLAEGAIVQNNKVKIK